MRSPRTATKSSPCSPQLEKRKPVRSKKDPTQPKINKLKKKKDPMAQPILAQRHTRMFTKRHAQGVRNMVKNWRAPKMPNISTMHQQRVIYSHKEFQTERE